MSETKRKVVQAGISSRPPWYTLPDVHSLILSRIRRSREIRQRKGRIKIRRHLETL